MNNSNDINIQNSIDLLIPIAKATEEVLNAWTEEKCLQFPVLITNLAIKMNWDEKAVRLNEPIVRWYVRNNKDWFVTRGAHGGIQRVANKNKKIIDKAAKASAKADIKALIDSKTSDSTDSLDIIKDLE